MKAGELCAGYGGLALAVEEVFGAETAWFSEFDPAPSKILAHHWPDVPNHGDMTAIGWAAIEPVDIISGGTPCQDLSAAGKRKGMTEGTRSNLWVQMREAIATIRPRYVAWENVRGAFSACADSEMGQCPGCLDRRQPHRPFLRALGRVLGDLSDLGYDCQWRGIRASDVGAPHPRFRVFILAENTDCSAWHKRRIATPGQAQGGGAWPDSRRRAGALTAADARRVRLEARRLPGRQAEEVSEHHNSFRVLREYAPAVQRWERLTRPAPIPAFYVPGKDKGTLNTAFVEWMMGLPDGWVTDPSIGLSRNDQLKALGNGVVPQQAIAALRDMLAAFQERQELAA